MAGDRGPRLGHGPHHRAGSTPPSGSLSAHYGQVVDRLQTLETRLGGSGGTIREVLDHVALEVSGTPDFAELARAALRSGHLEGAVRELRNELDRITRAQAAGQQDALAHVAGRTAPLEGALHELRRELELVAEETATSQEALRAEAYERILAVAERVQAVEGRLSEPTAAAEPAQAAVSAASAEASGSTGRQVGELADYVATVEARLGAIDDRTVALAAVAADVAGMYRELDRLAETTQASDSAVARLAAWAPPVEQSVSDVRDDVARLVAEVEGQKAALEEARQLIDAVSQEGQTAELELRRRLGSTEPLAGELEGMYRELGRIAASTNDVEERVTGLDSIATAHGEGLDEVRQRLEHTRTGVEELASGIAARLRELEVLPEEVERVAAELDHLTVELGDTRQEAAMRHSAVSDTLTNLVSVPTDIQAIYRSLESAGTEIAQARATAALGLEAAVARIDDLQSLPTDVEGLYRELDRLAEAHRQRGEDLAGVEARSASLESLADVVGRLDALVAVVHELERLPADVGALYRELERLDDVDRRRGEQLAMLEGRIAPDDVAKLHVQLEAATAAIRNLETIPAEVEGLYRELDRLTELTRERTQQLIDIEQRIVPRETVAQLESELHTFASDLVGTAEALQGRLVAMESLPAAVEAAFRDLDRLTIDVNDIRSTAEQERDALRATLGALVALPADMEGLYRELHRIDEENRGHEAKLADVEARTVPADAVTNLRGDLDRLADELGSVPPALDDVRRDVDATIAGLRKDLVSLSGEAASIRTEAGEAAAPLQKAIAGLRRDLDALREVASAAEADDVLAFEGLKDLDGRLRAVESLPERVEKVFRELSRASGDAITHQQGLLHEAVGQLHEIETRLEAVEALPADLEGLYAALYRVAESVKALREDSEES